MTRTVTLLLALSLALLPPRIVAAQPTDQDVAAARTIGEQGVRLYEQERYREALELLRRAEELHHAPTLVLYIARCHAQLGELIEARTMFQQVVAEPLPANASEPFMAAKEEATAALEVLTRRIPTLSIVIEGAPAGAVTLRVDGRVVAGPQIEVDPGEHEIEASADGYLAARKSLFVETGASPQISLELRPIVKDRATPQTQPPPSEPPLPLWPAWVLFGAGGASLVVGGITGGLHLAKTDELMDRCAGNRCPIADADEADSARTLATVSTITFIAGGVLAAGGAALVALHVWWDDDSSVALSPGGLRLTF